MSIERVRPLAQRLLSGIISTGDLMQLFIFARDRSDGHAVVQEVGHFVAHPDERERGLLTDAAKEWAAIVLFQAPTFTQSGRYIDWNSLPGVTPRYVEAMRKRLDRRSVWENLKINGNAYEKIFKSFASSLVKNKDGTYSFVATSEKQASLFEHACSVIDGKSEFSGEKLASDTIAVLKSNRVIDNIDDETESKFKSILQLYALSVMHKTRIKSGDELITLQITGGNGCLQLNGRVVFGTNRFGGQTALSKTLLSTEMPISEFCELDMIADGEPWEGHVELASSGKLRFLR